MSNGRSSLELTEAGRWESFPVFAEAYTRQIHATVLSKMEAPDMHIWEIEFEGCQLNLVYDDFPNGVSVEPKNAAGQAAIEKLYKLAKHG